MQQVSKRMSHKEAKQYRDMVEDAVMYQHRNGAVYVIPSTDEAEYYAMEDKPFYVTDDSNALAFSGGMHEAKSVLFQQRTRLVDVP